MKKRILSLLLILCMAVTLLPTAVFAEDATGKLIPAGGAKIGETVYQTLEAAVTAAASGDTIQLGAGKYTLYKKDAVTTGKDLTFVGQGADETTWGIGATMPDPDKFGTEYNGDYSFDGAKTITFKDMTLQSADANYLGFIRADQTVVEDCIINGKTFYWGYTSASFKNTTFNCPSGDYAIWTYSSPTMTFDSCTFNSSGKVINVFTDYGAGKNDIIVNFKGCTVNNTSPNKAVLNINDSNMDKFKYILNISGNTTVTGVAVDKATCSRLFGFSGKAGNNTGRTIVNFGNTTVWAGGKMVDAKAYHNEGVTVDGVTYDNGGSGANDILYAEGYKDNAFTITYSEWTKNPDGTKTHTVTKTCNYCGYQESTTETAEADPHRLGRLQVQDRHKAGYQYLDLQRDAVSAQRGGSAGQRHRIRAGQIQLQEGDGRQCGTDADSSAKPSSKQRLQDSGRCCRIWRGCKGFLSVGGIPCNRGRT